jgi:hypothetical protein
MVDITSLTKPFNDVGLSFVQIRAALLPLLHIVDMRCDRALLQRVAQLSAQETAGRIAGDAGVEAVDEAPHHRRVFVNDVGEDFEIIVIDDSVV